MWKFWVSVPPELLQDMKRKARSIFLLNENLFGIFNELAIGKVDDFSRFISLIIIYLFPLLP